MSSFYTSAKFFRRFREAKRGTTAVIFSIMVIPLMAMAGGAVDYGHALKTKAQLANTLDAAVLAALKEYALDDETDYKQVIANFVNKNLAEGNKAYHGLEVNIATSDITENGELSSTISTHVDTHILGLIGFDQFDVNISSTAIVGGKDLEIALVLDNTGSMSGSKIVALRDSANDLLNIVMQEGGDDRVKIALVPFAEYVNVGMENRNETGFDIPADYTHPGTGADHRWIGCMGSRANNLVVTDSQYDTQVPGIMMSDVDYSLPFDEARCPNASIVNLTTDKAALVSGVNSMTASGWTYIPGGLVWGWRLLSPEAPFTNGAPYDEDDIQKVIILMTDGANTRAPELWSNDATVNHSTAVHGHSIHRNDGATPIANGITAQMCNNIKNKEIVVFTIAFEVAEGSDIENLMKACAGNGGQYYDADDSEQLESAFKQIGLSLLNLRLSH